MSFREVSTLPPASKDFRLLLQEELIRRCKANPKYSLRAFARALTVGPSLLSMLLNSKRQFTPGTIRKMGARLGLGPLEIDAYLGGRTRPGGSSADTPDDDYRQIAADNFTVLADWYHFAILELISVEGFQPRTQWVGKALGISVNEAKAAVERLQRVGLLRIEADGKWINVFGSNTNLDDESVAAARRKLQKQILEKAIHALEETPIGDRDQSSMTLAIESSQLPEARRRLTRFRRDFTAFLQAGRRKDNVFHLSLSLYPVTHLPRSTKEKRS